MCTAKGPFAANVCRCRAGGNRDQKSEHMAVEYPDKTILQRMAEIPPVYDKERAGRTSDDLKQAANAAADADEAAALSFLLIYAMFILIALQSMRANKTKEVR